MLTRETKQVRKRLFCHVEFGGLSYHHFLALVLLQWVCTIIIIMLDFVDSCVGHSFNDMVFLLNLGLALSSCHVLDSVDFV